MTILLVDDDAMVRLAASHALSAAGHTVLEADSGDAALALAHGVSLDVLLLDVLLDDEDGAQLAATLRSLPGNARTPIVFLTGRADAERDRLLALGAAGVLAKPFDISTLAARLEELVCP
ncbi:MAG: response regulator [Longimicrobiales bacterium]